VPWLPARAPPGAPPRRFWAQPPCFSVGPERLNTHRYPGSNWRCPSSDRSQPLKAAPSSGADSDPASRDEVTSLACGRRTLLRQLDVPRRRPRLSKAGAQNQRQARVSNRHLAFASSFNTASTNGVGANTLLSPTSRANEPLLFGCRAQLKGQLKGVQASGGATAAKRIAPHPMFHCHSRAWPS
jgi:hypothetical protein